MALDYRQKILSDYERQLDEHDVPAPGWLFMGTNSNNAWDIEHVDHDVVKFLADFELPLLSPVSVFTSGRGQTISADAPYNLVRRWQVTVRDYDEELLDLFKTWHYARTDLQVYSFAEFFCYVWLAGFSVNRPRRETITLNLLPRKLFMYKDTIPATFISTPQAGQGHPTRNISILTYCSIYGGE